MPMELPGIAPRAVAPAVFPNARTMMRFAVGPRGRGLRTRLVFFVKKHLKHIEIK
jgi:hypothetical protein